MGLTIRKWFWAWQFDEEEKWLNEMAANGLVLTSVHICNYTFSECIPGEYNVRLELLENLPSFPHSRQYIKFIEDTGAEYVGSIVRWAYFRKKAVDDEFNLYSDNTSRINYINRILFFFIPVIFMEIGFGMSNLIIYLQLNNKGNLICSILIFNITLLLIYGYWRIHRKKRQLIKEQNLFE